MAVLALSLCYLAVADPLDEWTLQNLEPDSHGLVEFTLKGISAGQERVVAVGGGGTILSSTNGVDWLAADLGSLPVAGDSQTVLADVAHGNGLFVTVGYQFVPFSADALVFSSTNGVQWFQQARVSSNALYGIAFGAGRFVAIGAQGRIMTSPDGINWQSQVSGTVNGLNDVTFGNGRFIATGDAGTMLTSLDGTNWTDSSVGWTASLLAYGQGQFMAMGGSAYWTSPDGSNWVRHDLTWSNPPFAPLPLALVFAHDMFMAVGYLTAGNGPLDSLILTSPDGQIWTRRPTATNKTLWGVAYWNETFVAVGENGTIVESQPFSAPRRAAHFLKDPRSRIVRNGTMTGFDVSAASWPPLGFQWKKDGQYLWNETNMSITVAASFASAGDYSVVASNSLGDVTSSVAALTVVDPVSVVSPGLLPVTPGSQATLGVVTSPDASVVYQWRANGQVIADATNSTLTLDSVQPTQAGPYDAIVGNAAGSLTNQPLYLIVEPYSEHPLFHWKSFWEGPLLSWFGYPGALSGVTYGMGTFVMVGYIGGGDFGVIQTSSDGDHWIGATPPPSSPMNRFFSLYDVAFGNGTFIAVGWSGAIYTSTNAVDWARQSFGTYDTLVRVDYINGEFRALQGNGQTIRSADGNMWRAASGSPRPTDLPASGGGVYVTLTNLNQNTSAILVSTNASEWTIGYVSDVRLTDVAFGNGIFVAVGGSSFFRSARLADLQTDLADPRMLRISGLVGRNYRIDCVDALATTNVWTTLDSFLLTNNPASWRDTASPAPGRRFYRTVLLP